ncbi:uncharacterized protein LOC113169450 [Anabas testudineus]|uniref:uncharacterized protein LOC113169450 n=1 Tax=Anabas testudineus TaxID=64144 RepID=UPI000E45B5A3|nr:uncharacterized protein LOC113169450 [Anabas testudineus]
MLDSYPELRCYVDPTTTTFPRQGALPKATVRRGDAADGEDLNGAQQWLYFIRQLRKAGIELSPTHPGLQRTDESILTVWDGHIFCSSMAWQVKMPRHIKGLLNSCLEIPCTFDYDQNPPRRPDRVVWYQYVDRGYPLVYDKWYPDDVIYAFRGKTERISSSSKTCSLRIYPVTWSHHSQKIYPWVDPENIWSSTHSFYDTTVTIEVDDKPEEPLITVSGDRKVGQSVQLHCSVHHTCPTYPPTLTFNSPLRNGRVNHDCSSNGICKTTLTSTLDIKSDHETVTCSVRHTGGLSASTSRILNAECSFSPVTISTSSAEFLEGQPSKVTCTALYTCPKDVPVLTWNYDSMPTSTDTKEITKAQWRTVSTLMFTASGNDNGRTLTCYATFGGGRRQEERIILRVKRSMLSLGWSFTTPGSITGMRGSCIIIPCSFTYSRSQPSDLRVIWYLYQSNEYPCVYDQKQSAIRKFEGTTSLIGSVKDMNCSLKIEKLEMSHDQDRLYPWIDQHSITSYHIPGNKFLDKTTQLIVTDQAQEPQLSIIDIPRVGEQGRVSCSVHHTCLTAPPILTLSGINGKDVFMDSLVSDGIWQRTIERTWMVEETDQSVKCTVSYRGGQKATSELRLNVECPYEEMKMVEPPRDPMEGVAKSVICSVSYKCKKNKPTIEWNYKDMQSVLHTSEKSHNTYNIVSNLTFIGSLDDNGKSLTCTAVFATGNTSASETLHIKNYFLAPANEK